ncbi:MAG: hypothetical protein ABI847_01635 [Anaerolineales bacterium]
MQPTDPAPPFLFRLAAGGLVIALLAVAGLAVGLSLGWADPPRAGPLAWQDDFKAGTGRWQLLPPTGGTLAAANGALLAEFGPAGGESQALALTGGPRGDFTLEAAGTALEAGSGAAYGVVFGWQDAAHYAVVWVNGDGYAEAFEQAVGERRPWFAWQQSPIILAGTESNRVRVDVRGAALTLRVNDEILAAGLSAPGTGQVGIAARSAAPGRVVFSWVRVWAPIGD